MRRLPFTGVTIADAGLCSTENVTAAPLSKTHVSSTSITLALAHQTAVRSTDRKLQRLHASSLPRNPRCTTGPPSETLQTNSGSGRGFLSWAEPDLQLQRHPRKHWHQCEVMLTYIYDVRQMLHQSWTSVRACLSDCLETLCDVYSSWSSFSVSQSCYCKMGMDGMGLLLPQQRHIIDYPKASAES